MLAVEYICFICYTDVATGLIVYVSYLTSYISHIHRDSELHC